MRQRFVVQGLVVGCLCAPAWAKVWSVGAVGADFTQIQAAVGAALDGDVVLVGAGTYFEDVVVSGKALTLVSSPALAPVNVRSIAVEAVAAGQRVVVRGLDVANFFAGFDFAAGVRVTGCVGSVWIEDCTLDGRDGYAVFNQVFPGKPALRVEASGAVTVSRCTLRGGRGYSSFPFPGPAGDAVHVVSGSLAAWDCGVTGGSQGSAPGDGMRVEAGAVMLSGATVSGGTAGASSGAGLRVTSAGVSVETLDTSFSSVVAPAGVVTSWAATSRSMELLTPVKEHQTVVVRLRGVPGDQVFLFWSLTGAHAWIDGTAGWYVLGPPMGPFFLGTMTDPSGVQSLFAPAPPLVQPLLGGFTFLMQPYFVNPSEIVGGAPSAFVLLKA